MIKNTDLKRQIIQISYDHKLSHLGSCLGAVDLINDIYDRKQEEDKVILSAGHCGLALYVVIEKHTGYSAERMLEDGGIHPDSLKQPVDCSSGSLGHGLGIAIGMALADPSRTIHVVSSDGEMAEGSMWEALEVITRYGISNIKLYVLINGTAAYHHVDVDWLQDRLLKYEEIADIEKDVTGMKKINHTWIFPWTTEVSEEFPILKGMDAHYKVMSDEDYEYMIALTGEHEETN